MGSEHGFFPVGVVRRSVTVDIDHNLPQEVAHATHPYGANLLYDGIGDTLPSVGGRSAAEPGGMDGGVVPRRAHAGADTRRRPTRKYDGQRVGIAPWVLWGSSIRGTSGVVRPRSPCGRAVAIR